MGSLEVTLTGRRYIGRTCPRCLNYIRYKSNHACVVCAKERLKAGGYATHKRMHAKLKREVIDAYGGKCKRCGERDIDVLTLDHVNEDGALHRSKNIKVDGWAGIRRWAKKMGYPKSIQCLCFNCNIKKYLMRLRRKK